VQDDLLAFPQFDVQFSEDFVTESQAHAHLLSNRDSGENVLQDTSSSHLQQYRAWDGHDANDDKKEDDVRLEYESMILDGQRYLCSVPQVTKPDNASGANDTLSKAEEEKELARATDRGWELLSGMQEQCVYFVSGWWSYKFCYNDGVRQFHQLPPSRGVPVFPPMEDPGVEGFTLGTYKESDNEAETKRQEREGVNAVDVSGRLKRRRVPAAGELVQRGESRYMVQRLEGGTRCDLTGRDRRIEVQVRVSSTQI
jgi:protein OS-9